MKALVWHGPKDIRCDTVPDPEIEDGLDAIIKVTSCAICGSDLHLFHNYLIGMKPGDIIGHEMMGEVIEVGAENTALKPGDRIVVPFTIFCGECDQCKRQNYSVCERTNRNRQLAEKLMGHAGCGAFGYTQLTGGYAGGQAEYLRVPFANTTHIKVPDSLTDEQALFLGDILPTGWQAAVACDIEPTDTVAIWGCGPVGQMAIRSAILLGAEQVIAIDRFPERLSMAEAGGAIAINYQEEKVIERLNDLTGGKGPDKCIDAVGMEAHSGSLPAHLIDRTKQAMMMQTDRPHALREMAYACRPAGVLSIPGVYAGVADFFPIGPIMQKGLTIRTGQTSVNRWTDDLIDIIEQGLIDPSFVITHTAPLEYGPELYRTFQQKQDSCIKVMLKPDQTLGQTAH
ncbi:MAG TPA: zinc-dependent alcohol dehydrogenase [Candidatus Binatia bacterium]|nr:zinc-dependent alcohol dehydrogenase [Candidatus Binatia bacterium]